MTAPTTTTKLRSDEDLAVEQFNFFSNRAKRFKNGSKIIETELEFVSPEEALTSELLNFNVDSGSHQGLSFMDEYQLRVEAKFTCQVQKYTDGTFATKSGDATTEILCPKRHRMLLGPSINILNLFEKCTVSFNSVYPEQSNSWETQDVSWLNKLAAVEHSFVASGAVAEKRRQHGFLPGMNPNMLELENTLSTELAQWGVSHDLEDGKRVYYGRLPCFPFRGLSPVRERELQRNLGGDEVLMRPMIPPGVDIRVALKRSSVPLVDILFYDRQDHSQGSVNKKLTDAERKETLKRTVPLSATTSEYLHIESMSVELSKIELVFKRLSGNIFPDKALTNYFTAYRTIMNKLENTSVQRIPLMWDVGEQPTSVILFFIRDIEYNFKADNNLNICPNNAYRPKDLKKLAIYDTSTPQRMVYQGFQLDNLNQDTANDPSWLKYEDYLCQHRFLRPGKHARRLFNAKSLIKTTAPTTNDRGNFSIFPVDLTSYRPAKKDAKQSSLGKFFFSPTPFSQHIRCVYCVFLYSAGTELRHTSAAR